MPLSETEELEMLRLRKQKAMAGSSAPAAASPSQTPDAPTTPEPKKQGLMGDIWDVIDSPKYMVRGMLAAPVANVAGLAALGKELISPNDGDPAKFREYVRDQLVGQPSSEAGKNFLEYNPAALVGKGIGHASAAAGRAAGSESANPYIAGAGRAVEAAIPEALGMAGMKYGPGVAGAAGERVAGAGRATKGVVADVAGSSIPGARAEAGAASRQAVESGIEGLSKTEREEAMRAKAMGDVRARLDEKLARDRAATPDLDKQGGMLRGLYNTALKGWREARQTTADSEFSSVRESATAKEATGARADTSAIQSSISDLIKEAHGIGDLESGLGKLLSAIRGKTTKEVAAPTTVGKQGFKVAKKDAEAAAPQAKTFEELELARRYLNDIAFSGEAEGYSAILRTKARDAAVAVAKAMEDFVPEFGKYKAKYREMSEPLESLSTRFGKAIAGTEGGLKGEAYSKVANADLPGRLFGKKEGIDLMVDALAGGKNATKEARAKATGQVDQMVENWLMESLRGKTPSAAVDSVAAPQMRAALSGVPKVAESATAKLGAQARMADTSAQLERAAGERVAAGTKAKDARTRLQSEIGMADELSGQTSAASKKKGYDMYVNSMSTARRSGLIGPDEYKAAVELINRANTLEEKTARARRILKAIGISGAAIVGAKEVGGLLP